MPGGGPIRLLDAGGGLWLIVSSVAASEYDEAALARGLQNLDWVGRRAVAHEAVVEHFLGARAVLPMQLFTLFASDERALQYTVKARRRIDRILARIERQVEWGLRLTFDEKSVKQKGAARAAAARESGAAYLARKRDLLDTTRVQLAEAKAQADRLYRVLARAATAARRRTATEQAAPGSRLVLDAAFLVPANGSASFRASLRRSTKALSAAGLVASLTGPWPAYNFIGPPAPAARSVPAAARG
jgi:hypothetical protein